MKTFTSIFAILCLISINTFTLHDCTQQWAPKQIQSLNEIKNIILESTNALIIFDVDEVLITSKDIFIHPECDDIFMQLVRNKFAEVTTEEEKQELENRLSLCMLLPERVLIEESTPNFIKELQTRGIKTLALTSCQTGQFGVIPYVEHWRINQLKKLDIDFSLSFDSTEPLRFTEIKKKDRAAPLFEKGILFSKGYSKGEVLETFLKQLNWKPSEIIFIDDLAENHHSLKQHLEALHIPFKGFQYIKAKLPQKKINKSLIEFQFSYLIDNGKWINDDDAADLMELEK